MNKQECDILKCLFLETYINQRQLAESSGHSLGIVNRSVNELLKTGYIDELNRPTTKAEEEMKQGKPRNAVILAAGFGMRMVPINREVPKGLLEIKGECLIERIIEQLHVVGINEIYVVVGFMKEKYEYLIDKFHVELIVNSEYAIKNNLHSIKKILEHLSNTYIVPCDIWCRVNPFSKYELYSWYMVSDIEDKESQVRVNRKMELVKKMDDSAFGSTMVGICYLRDREARNVRRKIIQLCENPKYNNEFWEEALYESGKMLVWARIVPSSEAVEINTYEQLRNLDDNSNQLKSNVLQLICDVLKVDMREITGIKMLKKGMTNRSFLFECSGRKYIMRIPGEGTESLINRSEEAEVYRTIGDKNICDDNIYINAENGYKITAYYENSRVCASQNIEDVKKCMAVLKKFHNMELKVNHEFELFRLIEYYESLWEEQSAYKDYMETKRKVYLLKPYIDAYTVPKVLSHIDAVPDNFLFVPDQLGKERVYLIDWEYAGMHDPHIDIAMFGIYALYKREQIDRLIDFYFEGNCKHEIRIKIYCYISACGLLWSNWCEYKRNLGVDFGEYSLRQYRYAKEYYCIVSEELGKEKEKWDIE